jgi:hypothetical protein
VRVVTTPAPDGEDLCDGHGRPGHGCRRCCGECDRDEHRCPGCGRAVVHGFPVCLRCAHAASRVFTDAVLCGCGHQVGLHGDDGRCGGTLAALDHRVPCPCARTRGGGAAP